MCLLVSPTEDAQRDSTPGPAARHDIIASDGRLRGISPPAQSGAKVRHRDDCRSARIDPELRERQDPGSRRRVHDRHHRGGLRGSGSLDRGPRSDRDRKTQAPDLQPGPGCRLRQRPDLRRAARCVRGAGSSAAASLHFRRRHISKSLSKVATLAGFGTVIVDNRESFANRERFPEAVDIHAAEYEEVFPKLAINETGYIIIVTRGHRDDMRVLKLALDTPARYIAMIGSKRKVINVIRELEKEGIPASAFERIHAPMGLDIGAISPEEIAISVAAEMIAVRRNAGSNWRSLSLSVFADEKLRAVLAK